MQEDPATTNLWVALRATLAMRSSQEPIAYFRLALQIQEGIPPRFCPGIGSSGDPDAAAHVTKGSKVLVQPSAGGSPANYGIHHPAGTRSSSVCRDAFLCM